MLEHAYYSVISPEGCSAILFRDAAKSPLAAEQLKITSKDAMRLGIVEEIVTEPLGGAHRDFSAMCATLGESLERHLAN
jgi:acetyl-CoA carboxylase carboxyl transferase subunit alpha